MEKRTRTRVRFQGRVDLRVPGAQLVDLPARDLSHKGVFILGDLPLKQNDGCLVTLHLPGAGGDVPVLKLDGRVARSTREGAAIDFVAMDPDTYMHLRNLVLLHASDPEKAEEEFTQPAFDV